MMMQSTIPRVLALNPKGISDDGASRRPGSAMHYIPRLTVHHARFRLPAHAQLKVLSAYSFREARWALIPLPAHAKLKRLRTFPDCHRQCRVSARDEDVSQSLDALSIDSVDSIEKLKEVYKRRMREVHPDVNPAAGTTAEAVKVNRAYAVLSEVRCRRTLKLPAMHTHCSERHIL
jgi:hypothetical protein